MVYRTEEAKLRALTTQIVQRHVLGQPLLVGTTSVELSERVSDRLRPEPLQRLAQVLLIRDAWFEKNNKEEDGMLVEELKPLSEDLYKLVRQDLAKQLKEFGLSSNPVGEENLPRLARILGLPETSHAALAAGLQAGIPHTVLNAKQHDAEGASLPAPARWAPSPSPPIWPAAASTSSWAARWPRRSSPPSTECCASPGIDDPYDLTNEARRDALRNTR